MARRLPVEQGEKDQALVTFRSVAANATLLQVLKESGMEVVPRAPQRTTQICRLCGHVNHYAEPQLLMVPCENCGAVYDQDRNAAVNLLRGLPEEEEPESEPAPAPEPALAYHVPVLGARVTAVGRSGRNFAPTYGS